jgi:ABC-type multidrug transport system ATPase subunit
MIRVEGMCKRFGERRVLDDLDFTVEPGERVALLGLNGAGKTTLLRVLLGLLSFEGDLTVAGHDVRRAGRRVRERVGYVPQRAPHFDGTVAETVAFICALRGTDVDVVAARLRTWSLPLTEHGAKPVRALSGGMLQKMLLALALGGDTPILLLDEPTANLDPHARRDFLDAVRTVSPGTTVLISSHRLSDIEVLARRAIVLHEGRIVFDDDITTLLSGTGPESLFWIRVPATQREDARHRLESLEGRVSVLRNGHALGIPLPREARADVLSRLTSGGIRVDDFWSDAPSLPDVLDRVLDRPKRTEPRGGDCP